MGLRGEIEGGGVGGNGVDGAVEMGRQDDLSLHFEFICYREKIKKESIFFFSEFLSVAYITVVQSLKLLF